MYFKYILIMVNTFPTYIKYIGIIFKYTTIIFIKQYAHRIYRESCTGGHKESSPSGSDCARERTRKCVCTKRETVKDSEVIT